MKHLAFIDLETTGLDPSRHEILEIAVVRVDGLTLEELDHVTLRVRPDRIENADPFALHVNGYSPDGWKDAVRLRDALLRIRPLLEGAVLAGHNVGFDRSFLDVAWRWASVKPPEMDHHVFDTGTLAWVLVTMNASESLSLGPVCEALDIPHDEPHRALQDARASLEVARRLMPWVASWSDQDERAQGSEHSDGPSRPQRVYVCHPYSDAPAANAELVTSICRDLALEGHVPIAPQIYLPAFIDEATERERAIDLCLGLLDGCDELRVYGDDVTDGMRVELMHAVERGIPIRMAGEGGEA